MANKNLITTNLLGSQVAQVYAAPIAIIPNTSTPVNSLYCFLSKVEPWGDETQPPQPTQDQKYLKYVAKNMFVAKAITTNQISPVIQRIDWSEGSTYNYYRDDIDMFEIDQNGMLVNQFYIRNRYDQIFKCLWNNKGLPSTNEPFFQPGSYGTNNIYKGADGYKWKYIYTVDSGLKRSFMDSDWIPVPLGQNIVNPLQTSAGFGDIEVINVTNNGSGFDPVNSSITVVVTGDGQNAAGIVETTDGAITDIIMTNTGNGYSYANVYVTSAAGGNAAFIAPVSPVAGHGFDPFSEFGCRNVMITSEFNGDEGGVIPTDIDYRQVGILVNPLSQSSIQNATGSPKYYNQANGSIYRVSTDFLVAGGFGTYTPDEKVYQGADLASSYFSATVLSFDPTTNVIKLINIQGTPTTSAAIYGNTSKTVRTLFSIDYPDFIAGSGYVVYIENRTSVQRSVDGIEKFNFVLKY